MPNKRVLRWCCIIATSWIPHNLRIATSRSAELANLFPFAHLKLEFPRAKESRSLVSVGGLTALCWLHSLRSFRFAF